MKNIFLTILFIIIVSFEGSAQQKRMKDLIGTWEFVGEQYDSCYLEVIDSSLIVLSYNGEKKKITDYKIDFTRSPIWLDFLTTDTSSNVSVKSLLEIINDNLIKWQLFVDEERTNHFSSTKGELLYLRKTRGNANSVVAAN